MQSCILCLEEGENLKQLNHCGVYYIHKKCHSKWNSKIIHVLYVENH